MSKSIVISFVLNDRDENRTKEFSRKLEGLDGMDWVWHYSRLGNSIHEIQLSTHQTYLVNELLKEYEDIVNDIEKKTEGK